MKPGKWFRVTGLRVATRGGPNYTRGWLNTAVPGLAVTRCLSFSGGYCVTHIVSGCRMGGMSFTEARHAAKAARALASVADFTESAEALGQPEKIEAMRAVWLPLLKRLGYYVGEVRPMDVLVDDWHRTAALAQKAMNGRTT